MMWFIFARFCDCGRIAPPFHYATHSAIQTCHNALVGFSSHLSVGFFYNLARSRKLNFINRLFLLNFY